MNECTQKSIREAKKFKDIEVLLRERYSRKESVLIISKIKEITRCCDAGIDTLAVERWRQSDNCCAVSVQQFIHGERDGTKDNRGIKSIKQFFRNLLCLIK